MVSMTLQKPKHRDNFNSNTCKKDLNNSKITKKKRVTYKLQWCFAKRLSAKWSLALKKEWGENGSFNKMWNGYQVCLILTIKGGIMAYYLRTVSGYLLTSASTVKHQLIKAQLKRKAKHHEKYNNNSYKKASIIKKTQHKHSNNLVP